MPNPTGWWLTGNAGTVYGLNFLGTTDNVPFGIFVNGTPGFVVGTDDIAEVFRGTLVIKALNPNGVGARLILINSGPYESWPATLEFNTFDPQMDPLAPGYNPSSRIAAVDLGNYSNVITFELNNAGAPNNGLHEVMRISDTGVNVPGTLSVVGDILLTGADCTEHFDVAEDAVPDPGTVVVIDDEGRLRESCIPYDKKVAGVISGAGQYRSAITLDYNPSDGNRVPLALSGKVYCKADATYAKIAVGDLLTTSLTPGHAMRAPGPVEAFGAVIGKALKTLNEGRGLIPILVALQ